MEEGMEDKPSPEAVEGTRAHAAVWSGDMTGLSASMQDAVERCRGKLRTLAPGYDIEDGWVQEKTLKASNFEVGGIPQDLLPWYGTIDGYTFRGEDILMVEWKFGRNHPGPDALMHQCIAYSYLLLSRFKNKQRVDCHIYLAMLDDAYRLVIDRSELALTSMWLRNIWKKALAINPEYKPGDHCEYCLALHKCDAASEHLKALTVQPAWDLVPEKLAEYLDWIPVMEKWAKAVRHAAHEYVRQGGVIPGRIQRERAGDRYIEDIPLAAQLIQDWIPPEELLRHLEWPMTKLEKLFIARALATDALLTESRARELYAATLAPAIRRGNSSLYFQKVKGD